MLNIKNQRRNNFNLSNNNLSDMKIMNNGEISIKSKSIIEIFLFLLRQDFLNKYK